MLRSIVVQFPQTEDEIKIFMKKRIHTLQQEKKYWVYINNILDRYYTLCELLTTDGHYSEEERCILINEGRQIIELLKQKHTKIFIERVVGTTWIFYDTYSLDELHHDDNDKEDM